MNENIHTVDMENGKKISNPYPYQQYLYCT